jgi:inner membrane protein
MATVISHAGVAVAVGTLFSRKDVPRWAWIVGAGCAVLPDLDILTFRLGVSYHHVLGHRGLSHSIMFGFLISTLVFASIVLLRGRDHGGRALWAYLLLCALSHGLLDAMTSGGSGVALLAPFSDHRHFLPWRPILAAPVSVGRFFSPRGVQVMLNEMLWIGVPCLVMVLVGTASHHCRLQRRA